MNIEEKTKSFLKEVNQFCSRSGRNPKNIIVVGATKKQAVGSIKSAFISGVKNFGENFLQEAEPKIMKLDSGLSWHFIGSIQSRKAKKISSLFHWVQTVDRLKVAKILNENRPKECGKLNICIQVNPERELNKSGIGLGECESFIAELNSMEMLKVRGLMVIPRATKDFEQQRRGFAKIRSCFNFLKTVYPDLDTLSMGMSGDYKAAILEGTTMIRIGTNIFGERK